MTWEEFLADFKARHPEAYPGEMRSPASPSDLDGVELADDGGGVEVEADPDDDVGVEVEIDKPEEWWDR